MTKSPSIFYKELFRSITKKQAKAQPDGAQPQEERSRDADTFDKDLTIFCQMRDKGYKYDDIIAAIQKNSPIMEKFQNEERPFHVYIDRIVNSVNAEHLRRSNTALPLAEKAYKMRRDAIMKKYGDMDESIYGAYQDGSIAMSLLMKDGFSPEVVQSVIQKNSPAQEKKVNEDLYLQTVMDGVKESSSRYHAIQMFNPKDNNRDELKQYSGKEKSYLAAKNLYCLCAQKYMQDTHTLVLTGKDDENILYDIASKIAPQVEMQSLNVPEKNRKKIIDKDKMRILLPTFRLCLIHGSPVAVEPGRDTDEYASSILSSFELDSLTKRQQAQDNYPEVLSRFDTLRSIMEEEKREYDEMHSPEYLDALAAKRLLDEHMSAQDILYAIQERISDEQARERHYRSVEEYAKDILQKASDSLSAERDIRLFSKDIPDEKDLDALQKKNIGMLDIYQHYMHERIKQNPSSALRMSEPVADQEAVERILIDHPECDTKQIEEAIQYGSPRYRMPGTPEDYPSRIIEQVQKNNQLIKNKSREDEKLQNEFVRKRGLSTEGTLIPEKESTSKVGQVFNKVMDGKAAVKMLMENKSIEDIKLVLKGLAIAGGTVAAVAGLDYYVNNIITQSQEVYKRQLAIANYQPEDLLEKAVRKSADEVYLEKMHAIYNRKEFIQPSMDVRIMEDMLFEGDFDIEDIRRAIDRNSPVRAEACRDEHYMDYVEQEAKSDLLVEEEKLKKYQIIPRLEPEATCEEEYDYQKKRMQDSIRLPFKPDMDVKICAGLIKEGFPMQDCVRAISMCSPMNAKKEEEKEEDLSYGKSIFSKYSQQQKAFELQQAQELARIRVRKRGDGSDNDDSDGSGLGNLIAGVAAVANAAKNS